MNWQEICEHPTLRELPFKVETNQWGKIEMCPASNEHSLVVVHIMVIYRVIPIKR